jgi:hypothetical protein
MLTDCYKLFASYLRKKEIRGQSGKFFWHVKKFAPTFTDLYEYVRVINGCWRVINECLRLTTSPRSVRTRKKNLWVWRGYSRLHFIVNGYIGCTLLLMVIDCTLSDSNNLDVTCDNTTLQIDNTTHAMTGNHYNDTVTYSCLEGFHHLSGDLLRQCTHLGVWSGSSPVCTRMFLRKT